MSAARVLAEMLLALAGLALGGLAGWRYATRHAMSDARYWILNSFVFVVCLGACAAGIATDARWGIVGSLSVLAGGLSGLKYGRRGGLFGPAPTPASETPAGSTPVSEPSPPQSTSDSRVQSE